MPLDPSVATYWVKIELGLITAKVPSADQNELQEYFAGMDKARQLKIAETGDKFGAFNSSAPENKTRRNLARAMNLALALTDYYRPQKIAYQLNTAERETILKMAADQGSVRVKKSVEIALANARAICKGGADAKGVMPVLPDSPPKKINVDMAMINLPSAPVSAELNALERMRAPVREHMKVVLTEMQDVRERKDRILQFTIYGISGDMTASWQSARVEIREVIEKQEKWLVYNYIDMETAIGDAYKNYELSVAESQAEIRDKLGKGVNILSYLFAALIHAPFPVSLVGSIGQWAVKEFKPDAKIDPRVSMPVMIGTSSGFIEKLIVKLKEKHENITRVGPNLADLKNVSSWRQCWQSVTTAQRDLIQDVVHATFDEYFGDTASTIEKFRSLRLNAVKEKYKEIKGDFKEHGYTGSAEAVAEKLQIERLVIAKITAFKKEQIDAMNLIFNPKPRTISTGEYRKLVEMTLYCQYVTLLYDSDNACKVYALVDSIVDFFADASTWGILIKNAHHTESERLGRLNWKQNANNRKALLLFCQWYIKNINPFVVVIGAKVDGKFMTPSVIRTMCANEVIKINAAIKHGRTTSKFGSSWDWTKINLYYSLH